MKQTYNNYLLSTLVLVIIANSVISLAKCEYTTDSNEYHIIINNKIQITGSPQNCNQYLQVLEYYSQNLKLQFHNMLDPYIKCSAQHSQHLGDIECCNSLENTQYSIFEEINNRGSYEQYLYIPKLYYGICYPKICSISNITKNYPLIKQIMNNISLLNQENYSQNNNNMYNNNSTHTNSTNAKNQFKYEQLLNKHQTNNNNNNFTQNKNSTQQISQKTENLNILPIQQKKRTNFSLFQQFSQYFIILFFILGFASTLLNNSKFAKKNTLTNNLIIQTLINNFQKLNWQSGFQDIFCSKNQNPKNNDIFNILRTYGMVQIILIHCFQNQELAANINSVFQESHTPFSAFIYISFNAIDMFFMISGIFICQKFIQTLTELDRQQQQLQYSQMLKIKEKAKLILRTIYQRILRIWLMLFIILTLYTTIFIPYTQQSIQPFWEFQSQNQIQGCKDFGWSNLLMIDNLNTEYTWKCMGHSWYLSVDIQLFILISIIFMIIPTNFIFKKTQAHNEENQIQYSKNKIFLSILVTLGFIFLGINMLFIFKNQIQALDISDLARFQQFTDDSNYYTVGQFFYRKPWARFSIYILGLIIGYIIYFENKQQKQVEEEFSSNNILKIKGLVLLLSYLAIQIALLSILQPLLQDPLSYSKPIQSTIFLINPILCITSIVILMQFLNFSHTNNIFFIRQISHCFLVKNISDLSFLIYLIHPLVAQYYVYSQQSLLDWTVYDNLTHKFVFVTLFSYILAIITHIIFQKPTQNLFQKQKNTNSQQIQQTQILKEHTQINQSEQKSEISMQNSDNNESIQTTNRDNKEKIVNNYNDNNNNLDTEKRNLSNENQYQEQQQKIIQINQNIKNNNHPQILKYSALAILLSTLIIFLIYHKSASQKSYNNELNINCFFACDTCVGTLNTDCTSCHKGFIFDEKLYKCQLSEILNYEQENYSSLFYNQNDDKQIWIQKGIHTQKWMLQILTVPDILEYNSQNQAQTFFLSTNESQNVLFHDFSKISVIIQDTKNNQNKFEIKYRAQKYLSNLLEQLENIEQFNFVQELVILSSENTYLSSSLIQNYSEIVQDLNSKYHTDINLKLIIDNLDLELYEKLNLSKLQLENNNNKSQIPKNNIITILPEFELEKIKDQIQKNKICNLDQENFISYSDKMVKTDIFNILNINIINGYSFQSISNITTQYNTDPMFESEKNNLIYQINKMVQQEFWIDLKIYQDGEENNNNNSENNELISAYLYDQKQCKKYLDIKQNIIYINEVEKQEQIDKDTDQKQNQTNNDADNFSEEDEVEDEDEEENNSYWKNNIPKADSDLLNQTEKTNSEIDYSFQKYFLDENNPEYAYNFDINNSSQCLYGGSPAVYVKKGYYAQRHVILFMGQDMIRSTHDTDSIHDILKRKFHIWGNDHNSIPSWLRPGQYFLNSYKSHTMTAFPYCDGSLNQGHRTEPIEIEGQKVYFRGEENTKQSLIYMFQHLNLSQAKEVIVIGLSSGGMAVPLWLDYIKSQIRYFNAYTKVKGIMDGGFFIDFKSQQENMHFFKQSILEKGFYAYANEERDPPNKKCVQFYKKSQEQWKCIFPQYNLKFVKSDILVLQSGYDYIMANRVSNIYCIGFQGDSNWKTSQSSALKSKFYNLDLCSDVEQMHLHSYRNAQISYLQQIKQNKPNIYLWMPSCLAHIYIPTSSLRGVAIPEDSENNYEHIVDLFLRKKEYNHYDNEDNYDIDEEIWYLDGEFNRSSKCAEY